MFEFKVLAALLDSREAYESIKGHVSKHDLSVMGGAVLEYVKEYYDNDADARVVDKDIIKQRLERKFEGVPKHLRDLEDYLEQVFMQDVSSINVVQEILESDRVRAGLALADALLSRGNHNYVDGLLQDYIKKHDAIDLGSSVEAEYNDIDLASLESIYAVENLIQIAPPALNRRLNGGLIRGQVLILAARPEVGKTLIALNMTSGFIQQGLKVAYFCNEDPVSELVTRLMSNLSGVDVGELFSNQEEVMKRVRERGYEHVTFFNIPDADVSVVEAVVRNGEFDVVVVDQMRNLTAKAENNTIRLETVARALRNMALRSDVLVIAVTQAADSARDKLVLNDGDIDGSNTGIPGACDVLMFAGMNEEFRARGSRMITLAKNKRGGNHDHFAVQFDERTSRIMTLDLEYPL